MTKKPATLWDQFKKIEQRIRRATGAELEGYRDQGAILLRATCEEQHARGRRTPPKQLDEGVLAAARKLGIERTAVAERARMGTAEDQKVATWVATSRSLKDLQADLPTIAEALEQVWRELYGEASEADPEDASAEQSEISDGADDGLFPAIPTPVLYKEFEEKITAAARHRRWADREIAAARDIAKAIEARTGDVIDVDARIAEAMGEQDNAADEEPPLDPEDGIS